MPHLALYLLGAPRVVLDERPLEFDTRKAVALLAYLAVTQRPHSRDALAALLWPDYEDGRGRCAARSRHSTAPWAAPGSWWSATS